MSASSLSQSAFLKTFQSAVVKLLGTAAALFISRHIALSLGPQGVGILNLSNRITQLLLVFALFGLKKYLLREIATNRHAEDSPKIWEAVQSSKHVSFSLATIITLLFFALSPQLESSLFKDDYAQWPFVIILLGVLAQAETSISSTSLIALGKIWQGNLMDRNLSLFILVCFFLTFELLDLELTVLIAAIFYTLSRWLVNLFATKMAHQTITYSSKHKLKFSLNRCFQRMGKTKSLFTVEVLVVLLSSMSVYILGWYSDMVSVGYFTVAFQISQLVTILLSLNNSAISAPIASLYDQDRKEELRILLQNSSFVLSLFAFVFMGLVLVFGESILAFWGDSFREALIPLIILCIGQVVNALTGSTGLALIMAGYDSISAKITFATVLISALLSLLLIPRYGAIGAAYSVSVTIIIDNVIKLFVVKNKLDIWIIPIFHRKSLIPWRK